MKELDTTGISIPFRCHYAIEIDDHENKEKLIHDAFADHRSRPNREFFELAPERAVSILKAIGGKEIISNNVMIDESGQVLVENSNMERNTVRGKFTFRELEIPIGSKLVFVRSFPGEKERTCTVVDEIRSVDYKGQTYTLSKLAKKFMQELGYNWQTIQGPAFFKFNDEILSERRNRLNSDYFENVDE